MKNIYKLNKKSGYTIYLIFVFVFLVIFSIYMSQTKQLIQIRKMQEKVIKTSLMQDEGDYPGSVAIETPEFVPSGN